MKEPLKFPYDVYPWQEMIFQKLEHSNKKSTILESPTGSGKTAAVLFHVLSKYPDRRIVFLTRTNSQAENLLREAKRMGVEKVMTFFGRGEMCLFRRQAPDMSQGSPEEQSNYCRVLVDKHKKGKGGCPYDTDYDMGWKKSIMSQEDFIELGNEDFCPYFAQKMLATDAKVLVTSYSFFLNPFIRERFLDWMEAELKDIILIADEAHNIPDLTRSILSSRLTRSSLASCSKEIDQFGDMLLDNINVSYVVDSLREALSSLLKEGDRIITTQEVTEAYMDAFQMNSLEIQRILSAMANYGLSIRESKSNDGKLPRSYVYNTALIAARLMEDDDGYWVMIAHNDEPSGISLMNLETYEVLKFFGNAYRSFFMSGTISPFSKFMDEMGLDDPEKVLVKADYLERNLKVLFVDDVTSRYATKDESRDKMGLYVKQIIEGIGRNKVIFCTSYEQLSSFLELEMKGRIYFERKGMNNEEFVSLITNFREKGGNLFAVVNGRISEGIDLPGKLVEVAVVTGIPYPPPAPETAAMELFYEMKFRRGWEYAYDAVAATRMRQAIGRLIRSPEDRGVAIILDSRARKFRNDLPNLYLSKDPVKDANDFLS
ncbi:MAG: ATP-dependent DNA helicase [Thermoplasmata archaeon]